MTNVSKDVQSIHKILVSPTLFLICENIPGITKEKCYILYEGIDFELNEIENQAGKKKKGYKDLKNGVIKLAEKLRITTYPVVTAPLKTRSFTEFKKDMDELFLKAEKKFGKYFTKLKTAYSGNEHYWFQNVSISINASLWRRVENFDEAIVDWQKRYKSVHHLLAKALKELPDLFPPIQNYFREMGSLKNPTSFKMSFSCGRASVTMQRPVSDELFILPIEKSYFVIVGFDDMSYCGYDILEGSSVELLIQHLDKLTMWEKAEIKTVYCCFDPELVYELRAIFQKAEVLVDLEEVVHAFAGDHIRIDEIQLIIATAVYVFDPDPASVVSRYPDWIAEHKPAFFEKSQPSPQKLLEIGYCTEEELDKLFQIYSRVSLVPELLDRYFTHNEIRKKYKEMEIFQSLAEQEVSAESYAEKVKNEGLPTCIETTEDLMFHRVLMAYEDVEIDLEGFLRCLDESDERPDIAPS